MKDGSCCILRALSLGLCLRRIAILLLLDQQPMGIMSLTRATGDYRQLITNDITALFSMKLIERVITTGRVKLYRTTEAGKRVLGALQLPLELVPAEKEA